LGSQARYPNTTDKGKRKERISCGMSQRVERKRKEESERRRRVRAVIYALQIISKGKVVA